MNVFRNWFRATIITLIIGGAMLGMAGCGDSPHLPKGAVGVAGHYNYSPSIIETGNIRQFWWCSPGVNPNNPSQSTDAIYYESVDMSTQRTSSPVLVLAETAGAWDSAFTCNPKVIGGTFQNPLGDGQDYSYAMYYVATAAISGLANSIGVAFSHDGIKWKKYPQPVIRTTTGTGYGVAQPALYNSDHKSAIWMFYEDTNPTTHHVLAISPDGVHFTAKGLVTSNGLDPDDLQASPEDASVDPQAPWGDMSYDLKAEEWYAIFNRPLRPPSSTGGVIERGQYGIELFKIPQDALLTGSKPWQQLVNIDTNMTGFESNFIAGFVHDLYGNVNVPAYPTIQMYASVSFPPPAWDSTPAGAGLSASVENWILMPVQWKPDSDGMISLNQYFNGSVHEVTTGWISPNGGFQSQELLGHLYAYPRDGATVPFYSCKAGQKDYFLSLDVGCEGQRILGKDGYAYAQPGSRVTPLYRCSTGQDHFVSKDPKCEGQTTDEILGYVLP
jgi:hypothetical protein